MNVSCGDQLTPDWLNITAPRSPASRRTPRGPAQRDRARVRSPLQIGPPARSRWRPTPSG